jgi:hypothetical protein
VSWAISRLFAVCVALGVLAAGAELASAKPVVEGSAVELFSVAIK